MALQAASSTCTDVRTSSGGRGVRGISANVIEMKENGESWETVVGMLKAKGFLAPRISQLKKVYERGAGRATTIMRRPAAAALVLHDVVAAPVAEPIPSGQVRLIDRSRWGKLEDIEAVLKMKDEWAMAVLAKTKTLEIRSTHCNKYKGKHVGIAAAAGLVLGDVLIKDSYEVSIQDLHKNSRPKIKFLLTVKLLCFLNHKFYYYYYYY